jgi:anti-anti-sigma regulatory factor
MVRKTVPSPKRAVLHTHNGHARLMPLGTFDFSAYGDFNACVEQLEQQGDLISVEVDLGGVEEMDSAGLGALIELQQRLAPRRIRLSNAKWQPLMLIRSAKLWTIFDMERPKDTVDGEAIAKLFQRIRRQLSTRSPGLLESLNLLEIETNSLSAVTVAHLGGYLRGLNACGALSGAALEDIEMAISELARR